MDNELVVQWAQQNLQQRLDIRPITQNRLIMGLAYGALLLIPGVFILFGLISLVLAPDKPRESASAFICGIVLLIPFGGIILLARLVRRGFAGYLDINGAYGQNGLLPWRELLYVDHITKHVDRGAYVSDRQVEDNDLRLVFLNGSVTVPPLIKERDRVWRLIHSIPCEHRKDGDVIQG
jgi:hypothetical protein